MENRTLEMRKREERKREKKINIMESSHNNRDSKTRKPEGRSVKASWIRMEKK